MMIQHFPVLAVMSLFLAAFLITLVGHYSKYLRRTLLILASGFAFFCMCWLVKPVMLDGQVIAYWMGDWTPVGDYAIGIALEVDALSLFFGLLVTFTVLMSAIYSLGYMNRDDFQDKYGTLFLMLGGSTLGLVLTGDLFNMFIMIEIMTFAAVALTAFRNYRKGALEASFKYLMVGTVGSSMVLTGVILIYAQVHTLNMAQISALLAAQGLTPVTVFAFALLFVGFGIKSYVVPFHPIAADAYSCAPSSISMAFSGMVNKAGVYGMIRLVYMLFQVMDRSAINYIIVIIGTITMFLGVTMALSQHDFKRLLAFHSISQIGYVVTAIGLSSALGISGGLFHAMNHTLFKGLLFLCAGAVAYTTGTTNLNRLGGLAKKMPQTCIVFLIGAFSISGIPPFNGFVSKWMIYQATYEAAANGDVFYAFVTIVALLVSVMTLASFIKVTQSVFFGEMPERLADVKEAPFAMLLPMWIMAILCLLAGVFPGVSFAYLLVPATYAVLNVQNYIDVMFYEGFTVKTLGAELMPVAQMDYSVAGYWNPIAWLVLFGIIMAAVLLAAVLFTGSRGKVRKSSGDVVEAKYDTFFSGEANSFSRVGGSDLFWGLRYNLRPYFRFIQRMHSGKVGDYALWAVVALAVILIYLFLVFVFI